jgi:hypothetical protein
MHGLDAERSPSLLPLGDRPALQHIVESLVTQGVKSIEIITSHAPERVEFLLGNGDRWGSKFRYHLAANSENPYRSLKVIPALAQQPWLLIHAERYPCVEFETHREAHPDKPVVFSGDFRREWDEIPKRGWGCTVLMPPTSIDETLANFTFPELHDYLREEVTADRAVEAVTDGWMDVSTPAALLHSQSDLLEKKLHGLLINGIERHPGIWISRNVTLHPSARLKPPVYIGPNSRINNYASLGPNVVIGTNCIVDNKTMVRNAMVFGGSYIGEALEVNTAIVSHNLLVNARLNAGVDIAENFLIGRLERPGDGDRIERSGQGLTAFVLALLLLPITLLATLVWVLRGRGLGMIRALCLPVGDRAEEPRTFALPCIGTDAWLHHRPAGWGAFTRQFLPGLIAVIFGRLQLVGLPPRTPAQVNALTEDWKELYLQGHAGLITEASIAAPADADEMQLYLADAYYNVRQSMRHDIGLALKYFGRLFTPTPRL